MDGIHDLGGKQGFGRIVTKEDNVPFHHDWEGRAWAISRVARTPGITIDWWRYCRELIMPEDYLTRPYFDSWVQTDFATYIDAGLITLDEVGSARPDGQSTLFGPAAKLTRQQILEEDRKKAIRFDTEIEAKPLFQIAEEVFTNRQGNEGHTRLPQYARNCRGVIHAHHGAHVFPDESARGRETYQHLYTVMFQAVELWPENKHSNDKVFLDLWESYLSGGNHGR